MIAPNGKFFLTTLSFIMILIIFINLSAMNSLLLGVIASVIYFLINGSLLGRVFFEKEPLYLKLMLGNLLLLVLLGFVSWLVMIVYNLDVMRSVIALGIVTTLSSLMGLKVKHTQWDLRLWVHVRWRVFTRLGVTKLLYFSLLALSFYLLLMSRSGEVHTVWEVMHPAFIPVFFATTILLLAIIFSSEKVEYKLLFTIIHSILSHIFFVIVFPVGDVSGQQLTLGKTRLVFDNVIFNGWPPGAAKSVLGQIYNWFRGINFQTALSVIFARMFSVDVYWSHLLLVPLLWGTFIPVAAFMTTKALGGNENVSVLSSLLVASFPYTVYWGAISVPNSLGYIFFFYSLLFFLKYLSSNRSNTIFLMVTFCLISFLSHFLTGIMSFSFLLLAIGLKTYKKEKGTSPITARTSLLFSFIFSISLLPLSLIYNRFFYHLHTYFGLNKLYELPTEETIQLFLLGEHLYTDFGAALVLMIGPLLGLLCIIYFLNNTKKGSDQKFRVCTLFLSMGFLMVLVDYRILKLFMVDVPFRAERLWLFRDFIAVPFVAIAGGGVVTFLRRRKSSALSKLRLPFSSVSSTHANLKSVAAYILVLISLSGWVTASVYYGYPHFGPLQTTSYELEAAKYIDKTTTEKYVAICDQWMVYAGETVVGIGNPRAFYFGTTNPRGAALFVEMKENPSRDVMIEAMKQNNATVAYFIIEEPRLGIEQYNHIIQQAQENGLETYPGGVFYYEGAEKLRIFYYHTET